VTSRMHIPAEPAERSRPGMSTDRITAAALQIVDTEGSQALTMRRLGPALDRKVMTLYRYVPRKDALLDGVVARVLTDLAINPAAADWRQELRDLATSFRDLALAHPNAVPLLVTRPLTRPPRATATSHLAGPWKTSSNCSSASGSAPRSPITCCAPPDPWPVSPTARPAARRCASASPPGPPGRGHITLHLPAGWHREQD
jgi:hypothetical protein